jgi:hypothetical protein
MTACRSRLGAAVLGIWFVFFAACLSDRDAARTEGMRWLRPGIMDASLRHRLHARYSRTGKLARFRRAGQKRASSNSTPCELFRGPLPFRQRFAGALLRSMVRAIEPADDPINFSSSPDGSSSVCAGWQWR